MRTWSVWAAAVLVTCSSGCGTVSNLKGPTSEMRAFGGVRQDLDCWSGYTLADGTRVRSGFAVFAALDLPLSAVGDTLTLPYTLFVNSDLFKHKFIYEPTDEFRALMNSPPPSSPSPEDR